MKVRVINNIIRNHVNDELLPPFYNLIFQCQGKEFLENPYYSSISLINCLMEHLQSNVNSKFTIHRQSITSFFKNCHIILS